MPSENTNKKYYWLKLHDDFFTSKRIKKLRKLGSDFVIIYLKMQLLSLKNGGMLEFSGIEDDFASEIALDIDEDSDKVQLTISYLQSCGLLVVNDNAEIFLPYVEKLTGNESKWAEYKRNERALDNVQKRLDKVQDNIGMCPVEKEIEKEKEIDNSLSSEISEIVAYLNEKCGTNYSPSTKKTRDLIKARFNNGYKVEDFKKVIDIKVLDWSDKPDMQKFLRPETLFGNKFEGYLNQKVIKKQKGNQFNEMIHTDYDMDELERMLLEGR